MTVIYGPEEERMDTETEQAMFRERLMDIFITEYGRKHIHEDKDGYIGIHDGTTDVRILPSINYATMYSCLKDTEGYIVAIPVEEIADRLPILVSTMYVQPSIYMSVQRKYVPHYATYIDKSDIEDAERVLSYIDKLDILANLASVHWNEEISKKDGPEMESDDGICDDSGLSEFDRRASRSEPRCDTVPRPTDGTIISITIS